MPDWLTATRKKHKKSHRQMEFFSKEIVVWMEYFADQRKDHCQIMSARIGIRSQLELEDQLNRWLSELGRVCQGLNLKEEVEGLEWQEKVGASLT